MKIAEARQLYNAEIRSYREQQVKLNKEKQELDIADNQEAFSEGPEIVAVADTMASAAMPATDE